jgi:hypothetical protein
MRRVQTILAKPALLAVLGFGLSACVAAVPEPIPAPGSVAVVPAPAVPGPAVPGPPAPEPGYYYSYPGYYYPGYYYPCCAVVPNVGLSFGFHGGHGFHHR